MAGRKHHYIPQLLLRGFAENETRSGVSQVWVYPNCGEPYLTGTHNVFAQRDFYGGQDSKLDEMLTANEQVQANTIARLRSQTQGGGKLLGRDTDVADFFLMMSVRSRWIREVFEISGQTVTDRFSAQVEDKDGLLEILRRQLDEEPDFLYATFRQEFESRLGRELSPAEGDQIRLLSQEVAGNLEHFRDFLDPIGVQALLSLVRSDMQKIAKTGHNAGIFKSLDATNFRLAFEKLEWSIYSFAKPCLVLGDCGPLFLDSKGRISGPIGTSSVEEFFGAVLPISSTQLVIGTRDSVAVEFSADEWNRHSVAWSSETFVSACPPTVLGDLRNILRRKLNSYLAAIDTVF